MSPWTQDRIDRLAALWGDGLTAEQISKALGEEISRSAVLGKLYRLGLAGRCTPARSRARTAAAPSRPRAAEGARGPAAKGAASGPAGPVTAVPGPAASAPAGMPPTGEGPGCRTILTVRRLECRWPLGDPRRPGFTLCGCPAVRGAFCSGHAARAYRRAPETAERLMALASLN